MNRLQFKKRNRIRPQEKKVRVKSKLYYDKSCPKCGLVVRIPTFNVPYNEFSNIPKHKNKIVCRWCRTKLYE